MIATLKLSPSKRDRLARAVLNLRSIPGTLRYRKFVILGTARTGSTFLVDLLRSHGEVRVFGELFRSADAIGWDVRPFASFQPSSVISLYRSDPPAFLESHVFRRWPRTCKAVGFKLFYYHARTPEHSAVWNHLAADSDIRVLHLRRRNLLAQYCSLRLAHQTDAWVKSRGAKSEPAPIRLEPQECLDHFAWVRALEEDCIAAFSGHDVHDVWYEDLVSDREETMAKAQAFLGLAQRPARARTARQGTAPLRLRIANYEALSHELAGTPWEEFFGDDAPNPRNAR